VLGAAQGGRYQTSDFPAIIWEPFGKGIPSPTSIKIFLEETLIISNFGTPLIQMPRHVSHRPVYLRRDRRQLIVNFEWRKIKSGLPLFCIEIILRTDAFWFRLDYTYDAEG
jgi:hypothetical protein